MDMLHVESSFIEFIGYEDGILAVEFKNGKKFEYAEVPEEIFAEFLEAPSIGKFYIDVIKDKFDYIQV